MKRIKEYLNFELSKKIKILVSLVFVVGLVSGIMIGGRLFAYAQQFIDSFLDTSRVANTWNVEVDTANGEVKLAQRSCDNSVWFCDLTNLCASVTGDGSQLLVKRTNEPTAYQWKTSDTACDTPQCGIDGGQADNLVVDNTISFDSLYYPAREACKAVGGRLPTTSELSCIYYYRASLGNNFGSTWYWSSAEYNGGYAVNLYSGNGGLGNSTKTATAYARCVRGW